MTSLRGLVITDLDGTLLGPDGALPPEARKLQAVLERRGLRLVPATSRSPHDVQSLFGALHTGREAICSDGAAVVRIERTGFHTLAEVLLDPRLTARTLSTLERSTSGAGSITALFCGSEMGYEVLLEEGSEDADLLATFRAIVEDGRIVNPASRDEISAALGRGVRAISRFGGMEAIEALAAEVVPRLSSEVTGYAYEETRLPGGLGWLDLHRADVCKSKAMSSLSAAVGAPVVAMLGNGRNDVAALRAAPWSACPADACDAAKEAAQLTAVSPGGAKFANEMCSLIEELDLARIAPR